MSESLKSLSTGLSENATLSKQELSFIEKAIFAESLVNSLTLLHQGQAFTADIHPTYRQKVADHYNHGILRTVWCMMAIIDPEIEEVFEIMKGASVLNRRKYMDYARDISLKYGEENFEPRKFLYFCVHVTKLAMCFYSDGVRDAHNFAFQAILHGLQACDINVIGWDSFKSRAECYSPSAEAIINSSCVTTVCDTVPTIDSVQGLQVTSDESGSSDETSDDEETSSSYSYSNIMFSTVLSPVGEAANTYFKHPENQVFKQSFSGCKFTKISSYSENVPPRASQNTESSVESLSVEAIINRSTVCDSAPTIDSFQALQVTSDKAGSSKEISSCSEEEDMFFFSIRPQSISLENQVPDHVFGQASAGHSSNCHLTENSSYSKNVSTRSPQNTENPLNSPSAEAITNSSCVTTVCDTVPTNDSVQELQVTNNKETSSSSDDEKIFFHSRQSFHRSILPTVLSHFREAVNTYFKTLENQAQNHVFKQSSSGHFSNCQFTKNFSYSENVLPCSSQNTENSLNSPSVEAIFNSPCVTTVCDTAPTIDSVQGLQVTSDKAGSSKEISRSEEKDMLFFSIRPLGIPLQNQVPDHVFDQASSGHSSNCQLTENSSYSKNVSPRSLQNTENPLNNPSAEAIINSSCMTSVCDTVPTIDSVQGLQLTNDVETSSSSNDEEIFFYPRRQPYFRDISPTVISHIREATNAYFKTLKNQAQNRVFKKSSSGHSSNCQLTENSSYSKNVSPRSFQNTENPLNNPSAEAIINSSCVTTVSDTVPTIDSVQGLQVTSDKETSSSSYYRIIFPTALSPEGEAENTYFKHLENQVFDQASSGPSSNCQLTENSSYSENASPRSSQRTENSLSSPSVEAIINSPCVTTVCDTAPTIDSVQGLQEKSDKEISSEEVSSGSEEEDFFPIRPPGIPLENQVLDHIFDLPSSGHSSNCQLTGNSSYSEDESPRSSQSTENPFNSPSPEASMDSSCVTTAGHTVPTIDGVRELQVTSNKAGCCKEISSCLDVDDTFFFVCDEQSSSGHSSDC